MKDSLLKLLKDDFCKMYS